MQFLGEMLRNASTFHDLVQKAQSQSNFQANTQDPNLSPEERQRRALARTAALMGAGAGTGAAIGAMSHSEKGLMYGALVGTAGGLIVDQLMKQHEAHQAAANQGYAPPDLQYGPQNQNGYQAPPLAPHPLRDRSHDPDGNQ